MTQVCVLERVVWSRRGPIISALMQQLEINKYRALGLSTFPYPQQCSGWFTKSNWLSVPAPGYIIGYNAVIQNDQKKVELSHAGVVLAGAPHAPVPSQPGFKVAPGSWNEEIRAHSRPGLCPASQACWCHTPTEKPTKTSSTQNHSCRKARRGEG